jgi:Fe2+ or Zn2+ uptake regulation protein
VAKVLNGVARSQGFSVEHTAIEIRGACGKC